MGRKLKARYDIACQGTNGPLRGSGKRAVTRDGVFKLGPTYSRRLVHRMTSSRTARITSDRSRAPGASVSTQA